MRNVSRRLILLFSGLFTSLPILGQAQTPDPVGTWVIDVPGWTGGGSAFLQTITLRADSLALQTVIAGNPGWTDQSGREWKPDGSKVPTPDTVVSIWKRPWGRVSGDTLIWIGCMTTIRTSPCERDTLVIRGQALVQLDGDRMRPDRYKRAPAPVVLTNHSHPRPAPTPTGLLAKLVGTWEQRDGDNDVTRLTRQTFRPDSTVVVTNIRLEGADTAVVSRELNYVVVSGDTLRWSSRNAPGWKAVVENGQLSLAMVDEPAVPAQVYKKVTVTEP